MFPKYEKIPVLFMKMNAINLRFDGQKLCLFSLQFCFKYFINCDGNPIPINIVKSYLYISTSTGSILFLFPK